MSFNLLIKDCISPDSLLKKIMNCKASTFFNKRNALRNKCQPRVNCQVSLTTFSNAAIILFCRNRLHSEAKIDNMEQPDKEQNKTANNNTLSAHHYKTNTHQQCNDNHDSYLRLPSHATDGNIVLQIVFVKFGAFEPAIQFFRTSGKEKCRHH